MTPFIVWLQKSEIDELLVSLVTKNQHKEVNGNILNTDELLNLSKNLLDQNSKLINIIEKIEPLNPLNKQAAHVHGVSQKCRHFNEELNKMKMHCSIHNKNLDNKFKNFLENSCKDCPHKSSTLFSTN